MKIKKDIATSENGFIFNPLTGDSYSTNLIGVEIIDALKRNESEQEIKSAIMEKYDVAIAQLDRDWEDLKFQLKTANLLEI